MAGADPAAVLVERRVAYVMRAVLDSPMSTLVRGNVGRAGEVGRQAGDAVHDLLAGTLPVQPAGMTHGAKHLRGVGKVDTGSGGDAYRALLGAAVTAANADVGVLGPLGVGAGKQWYHGLQQNWPGSPSA